MEGKFELGSIQVEPVFTEREMNFFVIRDNDYLFRLVPGEAGFELSMLDKALDVAVDHALVDWVGDRIDRHYC